MGYHLGIQSEFAGFDNHHSIDNSAHTAEDMWPGAVFAFELLEWVYGILFFLEVAGKMIVFRRKWVRSYWNLFDCLVVILWFFDRLADESWVSVSPMLLRYARLTRLL